MNQFNNANTENDNDHEKIASSKYYEFYEMYNIEIPHKNKSLSLFHTNAKKFDDLQHLLIALNIFFDKIAITKTTTKNVSLLNNPNLNNYSFEFTPTETSGDGALFYIAN